MTINESLGVIKEMLDKKCLTGYWKGKWYITEERKEAIQTLISAVENRPSEQTTKKIEPLELGDLITCDFGDTDRIIDYILILAKQLNKTSEAVNKLQEGE